MLVTAGPGKGNFTDAFENNVRTVEENLRKVKELLCKFTEGASNKLDQTMLETKFYSQQ
jgi:flagellar hook-basal body complex protein FliE